MDGRAVIALEAHVGQLMGFINAATAELVGLIADGLASEAWNQPGVRSAEHWVAWKCGVSPEHARRLVAMARRRDELPECTSLFDRGALSEDQFAVIAGHTPAARDQEAAALAPLMLVTQLRRTLRTMPPADTETPIEPVREERRQVDFGYSDDGSRWWARIDLPADQGAVVQAALQRHRDAVFRQRCPQSDRSEPARLGVTWADALVHLCEASLDHLEPGPRRRPAHRNQIVYHVEVGTLASNPHLGPLLPDPIRRYLTCDADARLVLEQLGVPVALSSRRATVDSRLRTLIEQRDRGCRVPGCTQSRWLHIHHIVHREDQGPTDVTNLCCLCPHHHRAHHLGVLGIHGDPTTPHGLVFSDHHGRVLTPNAQPLPPDAPIDEAARQLGLRDVHFEHPTGERLTAHSIWWSDRRRRPPPSEAA